MTPKIYIPSFRRPKETAERSITALRNSGVQSCTVVLSDPHEREDYAAYAAKVDGIEVEIQDGKPGLAAQRNLIRSQGPTGEWYCSIDDDVQEFQELVGEKDLQTILDLPAMLARAVQYCGDDTTLWGGYPVANGFFMKPKLRTGLSFIYGSWFMERHTTAERYCVPQDDSGSREDIYRTLVHYEWGKVMRDESVTHRSDYRKLAGGLQTPGHRSDDEDQKSIQTIVTMWPELATRVVKNEGTARERIEIKLKDPKNKTTLAPHPCAPAEPNPEITPEPAIQPPNHTGAPLRLTEELEPSDTPFGHPQSQVELLARVIELVGFRANVVVTARDNKTIVTGNLIWQAAKARGWKVPCEVQKFRSKAAEEAHILSDYRTAQYSQTAYDKVMSLLEGLTGREPERAGFRMEQINALFGLAEPIAGPGEPGEAGPDNRTESIQSLQFLFSDAQSAEYRERMRALQAETGKDNYSEALLARLERESQE